MNNNRRRPFIEEEPIKYILGEEMRRFRTSQSNQ